MPSGAIILRLNPGKSRRCACLGEPVCVRDVRVPGLRWRSSRQGEPGAFAPGTKTCGATSGGCGACHPLADAASRRCAPAPARGRPSAALPGPAPRPARSGAPQRPVRHCTPPGPVPGPARSRTGGWLVAVAGATASRVFSYLITTFPLDE